jgi:hypothetical protein
LVWKGGVFCGKGGVLCCCERGVVLDVDPRLLLLPERDRCMGCGLPLREDRVACRGMGWIRFGFEGDDFEEDTEEAR